MMIYKLLSPAIGFTGLFFLLSVNVWLVNHATSIKATKTPAFMEYAVVVPQPVAQTQHPSIKVQVKTPVTARHENNEVASSPSVNALKNTTQIGTPENPTIDGGMIAAPDDLPVATASMPVQTHTSNDSAISSATLPAIVPMPTSSSQQNVLLDDSWATNPKVYQALKAAASEGQLPLVLHQAQQLNLPASVALIPWVESRYQDNALSPKGAKGAWQLMPQTAQSYGVNPDELNDFALATPVALQLLSDLHTTFGNWNLAFAAYNAGSGRVKAALKDNPHAQSIDELNLPQETKDYVHQIQALALSV